MAGASRAPADDVGDRADELLPERIRLHELCPLFPGRLMGLLLTLIERGEFAGRVQYAALYFIAPVFRSAQLTARTYGVLWCRPKVVTPEGCGAEPGAPAHPVETDKTPGDHDSRASTKSRPDRKSGFPQNEIADSVNTSQHAFADSTRNKMPVDNPSHTNDPEWFEHGERLAQNIASVEDFCSVLLDLGRRKSREYNSTC
jgi:hypothetical protein